MTLPVVWLPEADADLRTAQAWYEAIRPELAIRFALAVEEAMESIAANPLGFAIVYKNRRRAGVRRFPYGIFFALEDERIVVIACFHGKRNPRRWQVR
ncbi:MAG TPA: type II toxin-antitoxin system RelE/ParE family toxin [Bryobacteraceae bacterium]